MAIGNNKYIQASGAPSGGEQAVKESVRNEEIKVLCKKIRVQTNGKERTIYYDGWTYNFEVGKEHKKYLDVWRETYNKWNQGNVTSC